MLNLTFLAFAAVLAVRYFRKGGGIAMLHGMNKPIGEPQDHAHGAA